MNWIEAYYPYLLSDIKDVMKYIPMSIITGAVCTLAIMILYRLYTGIWRWKKSVFYLFFITYLMAVIQIAYLSRLPGSRTGIELGLGNNGAGTLIRNRKCSDVHTFWNLVPFAGTNSKAFLHSNGNAYEYCD